MGFITLFVGLLASLAGMVFVNLGLTTYNTVRTPVAICQAQPSPSPSPAEMGKP